MGNTMIGGGQPLTQMDVLKSLAVSVEAIVGRLIALEKARPAQGEPGVPGERGPAGERGAIGQDGPPGRDGRDGSPGERGVDGKDGEHGKEGPVGKLPQVQDWVARVYYGSEVVAHNGAVYQAVRDTGQAPPHGDWICLAAAGRDGRSFAIRGTFREDGNYRELDVVTLNGASFAAKRDDPGICPGDGWQLIAMQGGRGKPGERGLPGGKADRGPPGPRVDELSVDGDGMLTLKNGDGSVVTCDLYPVLAKLQR